jgi:hypothetical protein
MLYRVIDLKYSKIQGGIDDEPLQRLLHGHEVLSRGERLYFHDGVAHLLVALVHESIISEVRYHSIFGNLSQGIE